MDIGLDPTIIQIGPVVVGWHGLLTCIGTVVGVALTLYLARKLGIRDEITFGAALCAVVFGFVGARVSHVINSWWLYSEHPAKILAVQEGGLGWYGALIGGTIAVAVYSRIAKFPLARFADAAAPGIFLGLSFGRIGCTLNGDSIGARTSLPWGLTYTNDLSLVPSALQGVPTHPAAVYEILWNMVILLVLWRLWKRLSPDGGLFLVSLMLYAVGRFTISWFRVEDLVLGSLHQSHLISIGIFIFAAVMLAIRKTRLVKRESAQALVLEAQP